MASWPFGWKIKKQILWTVNFETVRQRAMLRTLKGVPEYEKEMSISVVRIPPFPKYVISETNH